MLTKLSTKAKTHNKSSESYGSEAAEKMGVPEGRVFKTLVVSLDGKELVVGVVPVSSGFRKSDQCQEWRRLLHDFYEPLSEVEHYIGVYGIR